jgi:hypothetical protein
MPITSRLLAKSNSAISFGAFVPPPEFPIQQTYTSTVRNAYPSASLVEAWGEYTANFIAEKGYQPGNTLYALGICADDVDAFTVNGNIGQFPKSMQSFLGPFMSGGLAGYPFVGSIGLGAFASHITDTGTLFISSTPHIGITVDGQIGRQYRRGQASTTASTNCGAVHGAVGLVSSDPLPPTQSNVPYNNENYELWKLADIIYPNSSSFNGSEGKNILKATSYIKDAGFGYILDNSSSFHDAAAGKDVFVLGGTFINTDDGNESYIDVNYFYKYPAINGGTWEDLSDEYRDGLYALPNNSVRVVRVYSQELSFPINNTSLNIKYEDLVYNSSGILVTEYTSDTVNNIDQLVDLFNNNVDFNQYGVYSKSDRNNKLVLTLTDSTKDNLLESNIGLVYLQVFND